MDRTELLGTPLGNEWASELLIGGNTFIYWPECAAGIHEWLASRG